MNSHKKYVMLTFMKEVSWALWVTVMVENRGNNFQNITCSTSKIVLQVLKNPSGYGNVIYLLKIIEYEKKHAHTRTRSFSVIFLD